jgi:hypothetical protein
MPFEEAVGRLKTFEECTHSRVSVSGRVSDGQLLLTQVEWDAHSKKDEDPSQATSVKGHIISCCNLGNS